MNILRRATALLLCFLIMANSTMGAFAQAGVGESDPATNSDVTATVCEECGETDTHKESCSLYTDGNSDEDGTTVSEETGDENTQTDGGTDVPADETETTPAETPSVETDADEPVENGVLCAVCGKVNCTDSHLYCAECDTFDCGITHTRENPYKPLTSPQIPANPTLTEGADVSVTDADGNAVTGDGVQVGKGEKISLSAWSDAENGENVTYQWQICYDTVNNLWADISGQNGKGILVSPAVVNKAIALTGKALIRCRISDGKSAVYSAAIPVEIVERQPLTASPFRAARRVDTPSTYDAETPGVYTVTINYVLENGKPVATPYESSVPEGTSIEAEVLNPVIPGYKAYFNDEESVSVTVNIPNPVENVTYTVVYKPTNVDYTVIHYKQNINDDEYTEAERETKQGLTGTQVPESAKEYEGFYALLYEKSPIAADGSTKIEIYYDRNYYLINFDMDGGYGTEPVYARYGAEMTVTDPTKAGYTFVGWTFNGVSVEKPTTVPAENRTYKAVWKADDTAKVTVVFWGENADDKEYSYIKSSPVYVKPGTEFTYSEDGSLICALEEHAHNIEDCYKLTCDTEQHTHSDSCNTCGETEHAEHTTSCYDGVGNKQNVHTDVPDNPAQGLVHDHWYYGKLIYINGSWYRYSGSTSSGNVAPTTCHKHKDACLGCGKTEHIHSIDKGCYTLTCDKPKHSHNSDCYMNGAGLDSNLWKFIKSDTVTVAADGSTVVNVYYDRTEKTLTFKYNYSNRKYQKTETITAKWGADISEQFKTITTNAGSSFWSENNDGSGPYTNYIGVMPETSITYYNRGESGSEGTMTYWGQDLNGEYTVELYKVTGMGGYRVTDEDRYEFAGFTYDHGTSNGSNCRGAKFYYTRNSYTLTFNDGYNDVKTESVKYQASLGSYSSYTPDVPKDAYEPGSVEFAGWYLNPECTGEEYKLNEHTMPADNLLLYAKWAPVQHTVEFYLDKDALDSGKKLRDDVTVSHGEKIDGVTKPTNGDYNFVGWFYQDGGTEKAFDFANMPVTKDMKVYGKWSSNVLKQYFIYYKIQGTDTDVADPTTSSALAGTTKTIGAKAGSDLYPDYTEGYFPTALSHSMTIDINGDNVYTFEYVAKDAVPYTVKYLNKETGEAVATEKVVSNNRKSYVTEIFEPVKDMMPDAYQKSLIVSGAEDAVNEIVFWYTVDTEHAYYTITHYTENLEPDARGKTVWTEYSSTRAKGVINDKYTESPKTIAGFTYDAPNSTPEGTLTADGLKLKLYYTRNSYPYEVRYLEQGTGAQLAEPKKRTAKYEAEVTENAIEIDNYTAVNSRPQTVTIQIESGTDARLNIITFYYTENEATITYVPVGSGTVSRTSESVKVKTGTALGSTATAADKYRFVGWYTDADCTEPVSDSYKNATFIPAKADGAVWTNVTYYAKFERAVADLTVTKNGWNSIDENQTFIFDITGDGGFKLTVTIQGNGSVTVKDLPVGRYTVTEKTDWSRRYTPTENGKTVDLNSESSVTFENSRTDPYRLTGDNFKENQFTVNKNN